VEGDCAYSARKIYLTPAKTGHFGWPVNVLLNSGQWRWGQRQHAVDALATSPAVWHHIHTIITRRAHRGARGGGAPHGTVWALCVGMRQ